MIRSALGGGRLFDDSDTAAVRVRSVASDIANQQGVSMLSVIYASLLRLRSNPFVITGSPPLDGVPYPVTG